MLRLRYTLLTLLGGLILLTVSVTGAFAYLNSRAAADELAGQILDQNARRIDQEVGKLLGRATGPCALTARLLESGRLPAADRPGLIGFWREVLAGDPEVTGLFIGYEATGETVGVSRLENHQLSVWETVRDPAAGRLGVREYRAADYPAAPFKTGGAAEGVWSRPWYAAAKRAGRPVWTDAYVFLGVGGVRDVLGVTHAAPVRGPDGAVRAVVMADFDLDTLSRFLAGLRVGRGGAAFLVEEGAGGAARVIAHPDPGLLTRPAAGGGRELVPAGELGDPRARAFLAGLPAAAPGGPRPVRFAHDGRAFLGTAQRVTGDGRPPWVICAFVPEDEILAHAHRTNRTTVLVTTGVFALAMLAGLLLSRQVARPLEQLADQALAVGRLRLDPGPPVRSVVREVDQLARAADAMKVGLRSFGKYLPVELVRGLLDSGQEARLGGERRVVTVAFTDIAGFTAAAEGLPSDVLVAHLGEYLAAVSQAVADSGGTVDKFLGDGVMAFWGAPAPTADHAAAACRAAVRCRDRLRELRPGWVAAGRPPFHTRFGIHTGEVTVGNIGSPTRMNYTVIGDAVNLTARLEGLNKYYGTEAIASGPAVKAAGGAVAVRELDVVAVAGRAEPVTVYELLGPAGEVGEPERRLAEGYAAALAEFRARRWAEAAAALADLLREFPDDGPAGVLLTRCRRFELMPPPPEWDGVNRMAGK